MGKRLHSQGRVRTPFGQLSVRQGRPGTAAIASFGLVTCLAYAGAQASGKQTLDEIVVTGQRIAEVGVADSANVGTVSAAELAARPVYRPGELLETAPGLIVSQHSGEGKANQYYLRGFNLDHGTDLRTTVDGMLVNERSHSHGQGWTDLNFLIPELADRLEYKKGPYYASEGDFASAGAVSVLYADTLPRSLAELGVGQNGYERFLVAGSPVVGPGHALYALEVEHNDGPFVHPDNYRKLNGVLRFSAGTLGEGFNVTAMGYRATWNSTDQIPLRALTSGYLHSRFDALDPTDGGESHRYSLSGTWHRIKEATSAKFSVYIIDNQLDLYSNFTYFLDNPIQGDQFNQPDHRVTTAVNASFTKSGRWLDHDTSNTVGLQFQSDNIHNGLFSTEARQRLSTTRQDHIIETSAGVYFENTTHWLDKVRTVTGVREDYYRFDVTSNLDANSGKTSGSKASPKLNIALGPWHDTDYYINLGEGFHSNDARGTTISVDPKGGGPADKVPPLVRSRGAEVGARTQIVPSLQSSLTMFVLDFDSELIFQGDAGTTSAGRPSRRVGFEFANYYRLNDWLTVDADISYARARFRDFDPVGQRIPGAVEGVSSIALAFDNIGPFYGSLAFRYFGPRALIEDNGVRSARTATLSARAGYNVNRSLRAEIEGFNLANSRVSAIDYYYTSRLPGEPASGVNDTHFHPIESRSFRMVFLVNF